MPVISTPRARPSGRSRIPGRGGGSSRFKIYVAWGVIVVLAAGIAAAGGWIMFQRVEVDAASCPFAGPAAVHAVLLDQSDPITPLQAQRLGQVIDRVVGEAEIGERIDLYVLTSDGTKALVPKLSLCRPKSDGNQWTENPARIRQRYIARFRQPLDAVLTTLLQPAPPAKNSPIMESLKAVCVAAFGRLPPGVATRLTVASDMIQFSPLLDHYKQRDFDAFSHSATYNEVLADCHRAKVDILYFVRPRDVRFQDRRHQLFWEKFFDHVNASLIKLETI